MSRTPASTTRSGWKSAAFLTAAGIEVPGLMQGVSQLDVWRGAAESARDHVIVENRHQPTAVHLRTYIENRV